MSAPAQDSQLQAMGMMKAAMPADPVDRANVEHCLRHGYVVLENCFPKEEADAAKAEIDRLSGSDPIKGRNPFEGLNTNRIYSLLNKYVQIAVTVILTLWRVRLMCISCCW